MSLQLQSILLRPYFIVRFCLSLTVLFASAPIAFADDNAQAKTGTIRSIVVEVKDIFEGDELGSFYRTANNLKVNTKQEVIRRELLFKEGEPFNQFLIDESARNLRALPFLRKISIKPKWEGDQVDIVVSAQDAWTFIPSLSFSLGSGKDSKSVGISDSNVLGFGKRAEMFLADDEGRQKVEAVWDDRRLMSSYQRLLLGQFVRSDGYRSIAFYGKPFRSLVDQDAWQLYTDFSDLVGRLFENGDESYIFRDRHQEVDLRYTLASGDPQSKLYRTSLGYSYLSEQFKEADEQDFKDVDVDPDSVSRDPELLAEDRRFSGPYLMLEQINPDYISLNYIDRFERTEDFNLGNEFSLRTAVASDFLGSHQDTLLLSLSERRGLRLGPKEFVRGELGVGTRAYDEGLTNSVFFVDANYYNVVGQRKFGDVSLGVHTVATALRIDYSVDLDRDLQYLAGMENAVRGYSSREFAGDKRVVLNLEDRFTIAEDVFRLASIGGAVFFDGGGATYDSVASLLTDDLYANVGFGVRLGFPRAGGGVVRLEVAFPLKSSDETDRFEPRFLISTGQLFSSRLPAETLGPGRQSVTVGLGN